METTITSNSSFDYSSKFKNILNRRIEEKTNLDIANYNFKSRENIFCETNTWKKMNALNWFNPLTLLHKFFYTIESTNETYISNIIIDNENEKVSLYSKWKILSIAWKTEFTFEELEKLSFDLTGLNRKIILVWIYKWKLTKIETQATSEKTVLSYLSPNTENWTFDISWVEKKFKENTTNILSLVKSEKQVNISPSDENEYFKELDKHISWMNKHTLSSITSITELTNDKIDDDMKTERSLEEIQKSSEEYALERIKEQEKLINIQEEVNSNYQTSIPLNFDYSSQNM